jgi:hypothetical protein
MKNLVKKIIKEYLEEARLSDILNVKGGEGELRDFLEKEKSKTFDIDRELPTQLTLKKRYGKNKIKVLYEWFDNSKHDLKNRIKQRSNFKDISEFTQIFNETINKLLPNELGKGVSENGRYAITIKEYNITIIIVINMNELDSNRIIINVITILPSTHIDTRNIIDLFVY